VARGTRGALKVVLLMKTVVNTALDPTLRSNDAQTFELALRRKIVGQDSAIEKVAEIYQMFLAGLNAPNRPIGNFLFLGPTGSGKTRVVEAMAEAMFGESRAVVKVDCAEFQHSHEIAKLIGSPPGYLGHRETHPLLTQEALNQHHTDKLKLTLLLFDEIEKASDALWQLLLGILDKATLTLGDNRRVDLSQCMIFMTSNLGASEMNDLISGGFGFTQKPGAYDPKMDEKLNRTAVEAARRKFSPEFMNRIDKTVVFNMLRPEHLEQILEIELGMVQQRILQATGNSQFVFSCTPSMKQFLLQEGTDAKYGARHLKRSIEKNVVFPLANLVATSQVKLGDFIRIDRNPEGRVTFTKEAEGALVPVLLEKYGQEGAAATAAARGATGRTRKDFATSPLLEKLG
jgi:ATP-dependent Clp protease ATP-binding subunit ClpB